MTATVASLWRHPVKSHGREALDSVTLTAGEMLPWDRRWAVTHEASKGADGDDWFPCPNWMNGTRTAALAGIWARLDEATAHVTLRHADLGEITFAPDDPEDAARFVDWVRPLCPEGRAQPQGIHALPRRGHSDTNFPSVSLMNRASHREVAKRLGTPLEEERWRGNIWIDGAAPWEEFDWIGRSLRVGNAELEVRERVVRCLHTTTNPLSGTRDADTLGALQEGWGHRDFGVYTVVTKGGPVAVGDQVEVL